MADQTFGKYVQDQLRGLPDLRMKPMFGGHGLYQGKKFFGILFERRLYFKTDVETRKAYVRRGMGPFIYEKARRSVAISYFEVPAGVLEDHIELVAWANKALKVAAGQRTKIAQSLK